jgi:hypothetical protein
MKAVLALSTLGGLLALSALGAHDGRAQIIPGTVAPTGAPSVPAGRAAASPTTTTTTIPAAPATLGGGPAGSPPAPGGSAGKTIRLGNPRPSVPQPEEDPGDMPPSGDDEPAAAPSHDGLGQVPDDGGQEHWAVDPIPHDAVEDPGDAADGDAMDDYGEEWDEGDDAEE